MVRIFVAELYMGALVLAGIVGLVFYKDFFKFSLDTLFMYLATALIFLMPIALSIAFVCVRSEYPAYEIFRVTDNPVWMYTLMISFTIYLFLLGCLVKILAYLERKREKADAEPPDPYDDLPF